MGALVASYCGGLEEVLQSTGARLADALMHSEAEVTVMTESEWLEGANPHAMVRWLSQAASERKLRLVLCASCRPLSPLFQGGLAERAVEVAECLDLGRVGRRELEGVRREVRLWFESELGWRAEDYEFMLDRFEGPNPAERNFETIAAMFAAAVSLERPLPARYVEQALLFLCWTQPYSRKNKRWEQYVRLVSDQLRDIFGNPFRPVAPDPAWFSLSIVQLAETIYHRRAFDRMPELADALEQAGCTNADILAHCRGPGPHVRGCWVIDMILGKL
jgi:hypothetical protein